MPTSSKLPAIRYDVWYEGDDDREDKEFRSLGAVQRFAARMRARQPIIDMIDENGHLVGSY